LWSKSPGNIDQLLPFVKADSCPGHLLASEDCLQVCYFW
jgi:hypothetical protein